MVVRRAVRWGVVLGVGAMWWWAVLRIVLGADAGLVEGAVAAGGWGLSLLPVHCVPKARAAGAVGPERWVVAWRAGNVTKASPHPRSGGGSDPS
ncbi:hypothetical protein [Streptomyces brasiliensis]|uniref:Uncharacterized protein n=1 Tax=Streptomyces brasiliensis TaxID=1954 RepID=A0A917KCV6_9ACTN|nr:hypothetical protein [Streptomyces brasiliensis]GGJ05826.1 hypothetical protein GCM10010121_015350 [Streptomyces brasiliensis]